MATKKTSKGEDAPKITRISASDSAKTPAKKKSTAPKKAVVTTKKERTGRNPLRAIGGYFAGAWHELREVRWPDRRATWGMTGALLGFTAFFVLVILLLDALFQWLFNLILGN